MYVEKFLQQVHRKLNEQGIANAKLRDTCIDIYEGENEIFKIDREGGMFYASDNRFRDVVDRLHEIIQPIVCEVDEYLRAMENGTELKARDFDMPYIKIAEYNEVVLAGREHSNGSFEFATWNYKNNSLYHGHYTTDYKGAREDFATRSGLVNKNLLFNKSELVEIYRCIEDTLDKAKEYYLIASKDKNSNAEFALARIYFKEGNKEECLKYIELAEEHGNEYAREWYEKVKEYQNNQYQPSGVFP